MKVYTRQITIRLRMQLYNAPDLPTQKQKYDRHSRNKTKDTIPSVNNVMWSGA